MSAQIHPCPDCNREFDSRRGLSAHHSQIHDGLSEDVECENCGETVTKPPNEIERAEHHFCSSDCHYEWLNESGARQKENHPSWNGGMVDVECSSCGSTLKRTPHRVERCSEFFCDDDCKGGWQAENMTGEDNPRYNSTEVACAWCEDPLLRSRSQRQQSENHFCSVGCLANWQSETWVGDGSPLYRHVELTCAHCEDRFKRKPSHIRSDTQFCSKSCYSEHLSEIPPEESPNWRGGLTTVHCTNCNEELERKPSSVRQSTRHFCNAQCRGEWRSRHLTGEDAYNWKGGWDGYYGPNWAKQRSKALERDSHSCQSCGMSDEEHRKKWDQGLHVHHIIPLRKFNDKEEANNLLNLVTLCQQCHSGKWEGIPLRPKLL